VKNTLSHLWQVYIGSLLRVFLVSMSMIPLSGCGDGDSLEEDSEVLGADTADVNPYRPVGPTCGEGRDTPCASPFRAPSVNNSNLDVGRLPPVTGGGQAASSAANPVVQRQDSFSHMPQWWHDSRAPAAQSAATKPGCLGQFGDALKACIRGAFNPTPHPDAAGFVASRDGAARPAGT